MECGNMMWHQLHFNVNVADITFYGDYSKAEEDAAITFQWSNNKDHILQWLQQGGGGRGDYISMIK